MVQNILAKNSPLLYSDAKKADIKEIRYMEAINTTPIKAEIRFTLFIRDSFLRMVDINEN